MDSVNSAVTSSMGWESLNLEYNETALYEEV